MNKKGNMEDIVTALTVIFSVVLVLFFVYTFMENFETQALGNSVINETTEATSFLTTYNDRFLSGWDYGVLFLAILLPIFSYLAARKIPVEPATMIITFLLLGFFILVSMILTNIYGGFQDNATFQAFLDQTRFIPILMPNLLYYSIFYTIVVVIGLFGKEEGSL
jgi:hypothetical protein